MSAAAFLRKLNRNVSEPVQTKPTESVNTLKFAFHAWDNINNRKQHGMRYGLPGEYAVLPRMELIFLPTFRVPKLKPKSTGFAVGKVTQFGVTAAAAVGSDVESKLQLPSETTAKLVKAYGEKGLVILESLTAERDEDKEESILVFQGVMKATLDAESLPGTQIIMEDFPEWLKDEAPKLLAKSLEDGVVFEGETYRLKPSAKAKGEAMIEEIKRGIAVSNATALNVLRKTKKELKAASKGINDSKAVEDRLDEFLLYQHPSFSLDSDVERASRANESITRAIQESGGANNELVVELLQQLIAARQQPASASKTDSE